MSRKSMIALICASLVIFVPVFAYWLGLFTPGMTAAPKAQQQAPAYTASAPGFRQIIVQWREQPDYTSLSEIDPDIIASGGVLRWQENTEVFEVRPDVDVNTVIARLKTNPDIAWVEQDYLAIASGANLAPNDTLYASQWGLQTIQAQGAWDTTTGSQGIIIAVIDSGIQTDHPDLAGKLWVNPGEIAGNGNDDDKNGYIDDINGWDFVNNDNTISDDEGHGTQVAGVIAAASNNSRGISGVCWQCRMMSVKVMSSGGVANYSAISSGIIYAAQKGARIINVSLGAYAASKTLQTAVQTAQNEYGALVIAGAGNDTTQTMFYPAAYTETLAVGGTDSSDKRTTASNYGSWVDLMAPGDAIQTTFMGGDYGAVSGTSFSSAFVSGAAGLVLSEHPDWSAAALRAQLLKTTDAIDALNPSEAGLLGSGRLNVNLAVNTTPVPILKITKIQVNGETMGRAQLGVTNPMTVSLENEWQYATDTYAVLASSSPYVTLIQNQSTYGTLKTGDSAAGAPDFQFSVDAGAGLNTSLAFTLAIYTTGGQLVSTQDITLTTPASEQKVPTTISISATWTADKTYILQGNTVITIGTAITVEPGTTIKVPPGVMLSVKGGLNLAGTPQNPIRFLKADASNWIGIRFENISYNAVVDANENYVSGYLLRNVIVEGGAISCLNNATVYAEYVEVTTGGLNCGGYLADSTLNGNSSTTYAYRNTITGGLTAAKAMDNQVNGTLNGNNSYACEIAGNWVVGGISTSNCPTHDNHLENGSMRVGPTYITNNVLRFSGIYLGDTSGANIENNLIEYSPSWAILSEWQSYSTNTTNTIINNTLIGNTYGIKIKGGLVQNNLITKTKNTVILVNNARVINNTILMSENIVLKLEYGDYSGYGYPGPSEFSGNNIDHTTGPWLVYNGKGSDFVASTNWWGTTDQTILDQKIYDFFDEPINTGIVSLSPILTQPSADTPPYLTNVTFSPQSPVGIETLYATVKFNTPMDKSFQPQMVLVDPLDPNFVSPVFSFGSWISDYAYQARTDISSLVPKATYNLLVEGATSPGEFEALPDQTFSITVAYAGGVSDFSQPEKPIFASCVANNTTSISASWSSIDSESAITQYVYAIGTSPNGAEVINWTFTSNPSLELTNLNLVPYQLYYVTVQARNAAGLWSDTATSSIFAELKIKMFLPAVTGK